MKPLRPIAEGREVSTHQLSTYSLANFSSVNWNAFLNLRGPLYPLHVNEFYQNFQFHDDMSISFSLYGENHSLTLEEFGNIMDVPSDGLKFFLNPNSFEEFPEWLEKDSVLETLCEGPLKFESINKDGFLTHHLASTYDLWQQIISINVYGKGETLWRINANEVTLLWCLMHSFKVNIAFLMASRMQQVTRETFLRLPYGLHLTKLFAHYKLTSSYHFAAQVSSYPICRASTKPFVEPFLDNPPNFNLLSSLGQSSVIHGNVLKIGRHLSKLEGIIRDTHHLVHRKD